MGPGNEGRTLKASRAYVAGVGTTGVLIASFFFLLTVGSTLVAFNGVPGQASNGDLSQIELQQQRAAAAAKGEAAVVIADGKHAGRSKEEAADEGSGGVLGAQARAGARAAAGAGQITERNGLAGPDAVRGLQGPARPVPAPGRGVVAAPHSSVPQAPAAPGGSTSDQVSADEGVGGGSDAGEEPDTGSGTGSNGAEPTESGSGAGSDTGSGDSGSGDGGTGSDPPAGGTGGGSDTGSGTGTGTGTGTAGGGGTTVGDTVEDTTNSPGETGGGSLGDAIGDVGEVVGDLLGSG